MEASMNDPLATLFRQFLKERIYLKNVSSKTVAWYETVWRAFQTSQKALGHAENEGLTRQALQAFVVSLRERGISARTVNTYLQALKAFALWLHAEGHQPDRIRLSLLKTEKRVISTLTDAEIRRLVQFRPKTFNQWRVHTLDCLLLDTGMRIDEGLGLEVDDVDLDNLLATLFRKGRKERRAVVAESDEVN
jgi:site-specific recombinase XerD